MHSLTCPTLSPPYHLLQLVNYFHLGVGVFFFFNPMGCCCCHMCVEMCSYLTQPQNLILKQNFKTQKNLNPKNLKP
jgi:hypothetical protein